MGRRTAAVSIATFVALLLVYAEPTGARASGVAQPQAFATCGQPAFGPGVRTTVDLPSTTDVVVADFNEDGLPDLAVFGFERALRVLIGDGSGGFAPLVERALDLPPFAGVTGDFNADGHADFAIGGITESDTGEIHVLLGDGSGAFADGGAFPAGRGPGSLATGDFNGDDVLDIAASDFRLQSAVVLLGAGDGSFGAPVSTTLFSPPSDVLVGDFNSDAIADLALITHDADEPESTVELLVGIGDGTFAPPAIASAPGVLLTSASAGDFNEDGDLDLALLIVDFPSTEALVLAGDGAGGFAAGPATVLTGVLSQAAVADLNGDGHQDLAVAKADLPGPGHFDVLLGDGAGGFEEPIVVPTGGAETLTVGVADFDGDARPDLVAAEFLSRSVAVLLNLCGNIADLSVDIADSEDPILTTDTTTFSIQVVNAGPDPGNVTLAAQLPAMSILATTGAVTTSHGVCTIDADRHGIQCALGLLAGTAGGNVATITVQAGAQLPGSALTTATVSTNVADPDLSGNSASETTQVTLLGGRQFTLGAAPGGAAEMTWSAGDAQSGYRIGRLAGGAVTVLPAGVPLPPAATGFVDSAPLAGQANCYSVAAVDEGGEGIGISPLLCLRQGSATGTTPPATFTIQLPGAASATLKWSGTGGETGYVLGIYQSGRPARYRTFPATQTEASILTDLQPICFVLASASGSTVTGSSDMLCAVP